MSTNRVVLGVQNDGSVGLRVSASGVDADVGTGQGGDFTFNSDWTDIAKIYQIGYVSFAASVKRYDATGATYFDVGGYQALYTSLGYRPFLETRRVNPSTNTINDDYWTSSAVCGAKPNVWRDCWAILEGSSSSDNVLYVVYKIAAPLDGGGAW